MRIAFIVWHFPVLTETFILNQITGLIDRGQGVDIFTFGSPRNDNTRIDPKVEKYRLLDRTYRMPGKPANYFLRLLKALRYLPAKSFHDFRISLQSLNVFKYGDYAKSLMSLYHTIPLRGKKAYDIIHCQYGELGVMTTMLRQVGAIQGRVVVSFRGYDVGKYLKKRGTNAYRGLFDQADCLLPNCEYFKRRLLELGCPQEKIKVHPSGIDCRPFTFAPRIPPAQGRIRIVSVGRLVEKKGMEYGIRAFAKVAKLKPHLEYYIAGDGPSKKYLRQVREELALNGRLKFHGGKYHHEIIEFLNSAHIFLAPSVTDKAGNEEGIPNTLKEAMAAGLPAISTRHGGISELVEDGVTGFLVPERDVDALAEKLNYLIDHPDLWPRMGKAAHDFVEEHYDANKLNDELLAIYKKVALSPG